MIRPTAWLLICAGGACGAVGALLGLYRSCNRALDGLRF